MTMMIKQFRFVWPETRGAPKSRQTRVPACTLSYLAAGADAMKRFRRTVVYVLQRSSFYGGIGRGH